MRELAGPPHTVYEVAFVPGDPPRLAAAVNNAAYLWPADGGEPAALAWDETAWGEPRLEASPDGRWLVAGPPERPRVWDVSAARPKPPRELPLPGLLAARFAAPDRMRVACHDPAGGGYRLLVGELPMKGPVKPVRAAAVPLDPELAGRVRLINPADCRQTVTLSADGALLALAAHRDPVSHVFSAAGEPVARIAVRRSPSGLSLSPDGSRLAVDAGTTVYVFDVASREPVCQWKTKYSYFPRLAWSPDGRRLARTDRSTTVRVYDPETGKEELAVGTKRGVLVCAAFSPDGLTLATGTHDGPVRVWDVG